MHEIDDNDIQRYKHSQNEIEIARKAKADNAVYMLELFGGKLSLTDVLDTDLPLLNQLHDAKVRLLESINNKKQ